jgi:hypothetical protein
MHPRAALHLAGFWGSCWQLCREHRALPLWQLPASEAPSIRPALQRKAAEPAELAALNRTTSWVSLAGLCAEAFASPAKAWKACPNRPFIHFSALPLRPAVPSPTPGKGCLWRY